MFEVPVLFLIFNRPELTQLVFQSIRDLKPKFLFIAADGPREGFPDDIINCRLCKKIVSEIDWDCEIKTLFREHNLGCGQAPSEAITWFFEHVEEGIILEDDCNPNKTFFSYCKSLLSKYRNDDQIMMISGTSYQAQNLDNNSYYFSKYVHVWGWATWRNAWKKYRYDLEDQPQDLRKSIIRQTFSNKRERKLWEHNINIIIKGLDAWDYQWMYWIWKNNGLTVIPWKNMISNIGFGIHATHTFNENSDQSQMAQYEIIEIIHPKTIILNKKADRYERFNILIPTDFQHFKQRSVSACKKILRLINIF